MLALLIIENFLNQGFFIFIYNVNMFFCFGLLLSEKILSLSCLRTALFSFFFLIFRLFKFLWNSIFLSNYHCNLNGLILDFSIKLNLFALLVDNIS